MASPANQDSKIKCCLFSFPSKSFKCKYSYGLWLFAYLLVQITFKMRALNHNGFSLPCYTMLTTHVLLMSISSIHFCISCLIWQENIPINLFSFIHHRFWQQECEQRQRDVEFREMLLPPHSLYHRKPPVLKSQVSIYSTTAKHIYCFFFF